MSRLKKYIIYKHLNKINGKIYIGVTNDIGRRWRSGGIEYKPPKNETQHHR
ncbi:TPA: GIY-YIG nuclease family protein, partial [Enterococcus faecium]